ncbi:MAG: basic endochitinase, partial [Corynebacterium sp.]|nr:basic endochitinase [Corynebacterium sp.]
MDTQTLREVMGSVPGVDYAALLPGYLGVMKAANITTPRRAAMFAAQLGHESNGLRDMRERASGAEYEGRRNLGNVHPGDGVRFAGRGPIQLTGRNNYRAFTRWAQANGHTTLDFEKEPERLEEPKWGFLAASWYWVAARPQINHMADNGDVHGVTRAINGGLNGLSDRRARYQRALAMGARLLPGESKPPMEKVLDYSRDQVAQDTYYFCGPASVQTIVKAASGKFLTERELASQLGTTQNGTDWIGLFPAVLNRHLAGAAYKHT